MLKFFRRIRHKLIEEGNLKRYFLYGIGEILLVMIGILLALQVNNWSQKKANIKTEIKVLQSINENLREDEENMNQVLKKYENTLSSIERIFSEDDIPSDSLKSLFASSTSSRTFIPITSAFNRSMNSGELSLIREDGLAQMIQRLYNIEYSSFGINQENVRDLHKQIRDLLTEFDAIEVRKFTRTKEILIAQNNMPLNLQNLALLVDNSNFRKILKHYHFNISNISQIIDNIKIRNSQLQKEINYYLNTEEIQSN